VFVVTIVVLGMFSLPAAETIEVVVPFFWGGLGDGGGRKLLILRSGNLIFVGTNGGFLSVVGFCPACFKDDITEG
jgi:hypothetical protein